MANDIAAADWTSDGKRLAVVRVRPGFQQLEFPIGNVLYQTTGAIGSPRISPKGDLIAFLDQPLGSSGTLGTVATVDLKGNKKTLTQFWLGSLTGLAWSSSGDEILFTASAYAVASSVYAVNPSGRQRLIAHLPGTFSMLDVAPDGRLLMARAVLSTAMFYQPTLDSKETDMYWHDLSWVTDISRDGKALLFSEGGDATRSGEDYVAYIRRTDGSAAVRLGPGLPLEISPDGRWALVLGSSRAPSQLLFLPTGTGDARPLTHDGIHHEGAAWTPDGKRIVFVGNEPGHRIRYYVQSVDGGPPRPITPENVNFNNSDPVAVSPDGKVCGGCRSGWEDRALPFGQWCAAYSSQTSRRFRSVALVPGQLAHGVSGRRCAREDHSSGRRNRRADSVEGVGSDQQNGTPQYPLYTGRCGLSEFSLLGHIQCFGLVDRRRPALTPARHREPALKK